jgi:predicted N-acetyltransferase YhbS
MTEPLIRPATADDAPSLAGLIGQLGYAVTAAEVAERLRQMEGGGRQVLVAELEGEAVGCLSTSIMHVLHRPAPVGRISMMVVEAAVRGRGIGAALVRAAESALVARGCKLVEVTSNLARAEAHGFYEHLGYERTSFRFARDASEPGP